MHLGKRGDFDAFFWGTSDKENINIIIIVVVIIIFSHIIFCWLNILKCIRKEGAMLFSTTNKKIKTVLNKQNRRFIFLQTGDH